MLRCSGGVDGKPLTRAVELALAAHRNRCRSQRGVGLQLEISPGNGMLDIVVKPLISDRLLDSRDKPAAVVYINECRNPGIELDPAVLVGMYGFTNCESQLAALLARGTNLSDAAAQLGVSINTVKTHLRGIYEKMGTNKQAPGRRPAQPFQRAAALITGCGTLARNHVAAPAQGGAGILR